MNDSVKISMPTQVYKKLAEILYTGNAVPLTSAEMLRVNETKRSIMEAIHVWFNVQ